jgi:hypothetical protein
MRSGRNGSAGGRISGKPGRAVSCLLHKTHANYELQHMPRSVGRPGVRHMYKGRQEMSIHLVSSFDMGMWNLGTAKCVPGPGGYGLVFLN